MKIFKRNNNVKHLFGNMQEGFALHQIICDVDGNPIDYKFLDVNKSFEKITGLKKEKIINKTVKQILPGTEKYWIDKYGAVALSGIPITFTNYSKELNKYFSVSVYSPQKGQFASLITDVTTIKQYEKQLREERTLFQTTLHSIGDGIIATDQYGKVYIMNAVAEELTGWLSNEAVGMDFDDIFKVVNECTGERCLSPAKHVAKTGEIIELGNQSVLINKKGIKVPIENNASPIKDEKGNIVGAVVVFRDFTEKKEKQDEILYLSYHDQLTGLYNRRYFELELERLETIENLPMTIAMLDVNGLKLVNDAFGHQMGDELLIRISKILKRECRANDIIARIGGDEFVIIFPMTKYEDVSKIVNRIYKSSNEENFDNVIISVSIGWETRKSLNELMMDVLNKAEEYMYRKKLTESQNMRNNTVEKILNTLFENNYREKFHSERITYFCRKMGEALHLEADLLKDLETVSLMHDIGKIVINPSLLDKPDELTETEYYEVKRHSEGGYQILKSVDAYSPLAEHVLSHHERWDGSGYPRGIKGEEISLIARILAVADAFDAMTSERPYRNALSNDEALNELKINAGSQFDENIVKLFVDNYSTIIQRQYI